MKIEERKAKVLINKAGGTAGPDGKSYRVVLPPVLREFAGIEKDIVTIGATSRLEIWDRERWNEYCLEAADSFEEDASYFPDIRL